MPFAIRRTLTQSLGLWFAVAFLLPQAVQAQTVVLVDQLDDYTGRYIAIRNQDDDTASVTTADDFSVPDGTTWTIWEVFINGAYVETPDPNPDGSPQCVSADIGFWSNDSDRPGEALFFYEGVAAASDDNGQLTFAIEDTDLTGGTYWLSLQCVGNLGTNANGARLF
ncbi:MAG: hypothetical protein HKN13_00865, partial [Rhodothermales bacterium]|nr:hypothetical protein [Rhodothermales bacterium]